MDKGTIYVSGEIIEEAWENITATLDMVTVCREVNVVKYLSSVLFKEYQKTLIPLATLSKQMQEKRKREREEASKNNPLFGVIARFATDFVKVEENEEDKLQEGVSSLLKKINEREFERSKTVLSKDKDHGFVVDGTEAKPVLERLETEMNSHILESIKESARFLDIPSLIPKHPSSFEIETYSKLNEPNIADDFLPKPALYPSPFEGIQPKKSTRVQKKILDTSSKKSKFSKL